MLAVLWFISGGIVTLDNLGIVSMWAEGVFADYTDMREVKMNTVEDSYRDKPPVAFLQNGHEVFTTWPRATVQPHRLACDFGSGTVVALSHFSVYAANIFDEGGNVASVVNFTEAPPCTSIEGQNLADVALADCHAGACNVKVLYKDGQALASCGVKSGRGPAVLMQGFADSSVGSQDISNAWLDTAADSTTSGEVEERLVSFTHADTCSAGGSNCAYVATTRKRILEMHLSDSQGMSRTWFPTRIIEVGSTAGENVDERAPQLIGDGFLGVLRDRTHLDILNPKTGHITGRVALPDGRWASACSGPEHFYLLSQGPAARLYRFGIPSMLRPPRSKKAHTSKNMRGQAALAL
eukprot:NODE_3995_length_1951_cov_5.866776.p1 GENE.NODE_3995_length_1951_cov_5.866776~~NODE_3995_length_1951_cov_5.866776.p1  ORF type:complete len:352 (-),score=104.40 NODE_3995_length_1951_cov_5.866776:668-1723(-)